MSTCYGCGLNDCECPPSDAALALSILQTLTTERVFVWEGWSNTTAYVDSRGEAFTFDDDEARLIMRLQTEAWEADRASGATP